MIQGNLCEKYCACITDECRNRALGKNLLVFSGMSMIPDIMHVFARMSM